ncbi:hypothetical protein [Desulfobacterium sp. N47]|uniref:Lipoprotein n=1 Tax=uncultured Desulfobacterium sp. TaxID=201089 RepID=E1YAY8_9BACT|nr:unknown protein [uncultured Desulfobacterium sp.]
MKKYLQLAMLVLICIEAFAGCAISENQLSTGRYRMKFVPNTETKFSQVLAIEENNKFRVSGYLRLKVLNPIDIPGYVEVALLTPNGEVFDLEKVPYYPEKSLHGRKCHKKGHFSAIFPEVPSAGTTVRLNNVN